MNRDYPFETELDGKTYRGRWTLKLGDRICVTSAWGTETVALAGAKPEACAPKVLQRIVKACQKRRADGLKHQERELEKIRKRLARERERADRP